MFSSEAKNYELTNILHFVNFIYDSDLDIRNENLPRLPSKLRMILQDDNGNKYSVEIQGQIDVSKIQKVIQIYETLSEHKDSVETNNNDSLYNRLLSIIKSDLIDKRFTSSDVQEIYEDKYSEPIKLAAVSTYLARFSIHGILKREKAGRTWAYTLVTGNHDENHKVLSHKPTFGQRSSLRG